MTYCNKITSDKIYQMNENELNQTLNTCKNCSKYYQCDTIALMNDELQLKQGELLKCPHCERYQDFSDCPDLFYPDDDCTADLYKQYKLQLELNQKGYNIVTCGHCGQVFIYRI